MWLGLRSAHAVRQASLHVVKPTDIKHTPRCHPYRLPVPCPHLTLLQHMHPESSAHEGYALVPPVLAQLPSLQSLTLNINSGQRVDLTPAAAIPEVNLVITLAHYEQTPFNK